MFKTSDNARGVSFLLLALLTLLLQTIAVKWPSGDYPVLKIKDSFGQTETMETLNNVVRAGKVRHIGASAIWTMPGMQSSQP